MSAFRWSSIGLLALTVVAGAGIGLQRQLADGARQEIALLRDENQRLAQLRAENSQLQAAQTPAADVERLRADHAAVTRLRREIEEMKIRADQRTRAVAVPVVSPTAVPPVSPSAPALELRLVVAGDGVLSLDGTPLDPAAVRRRFEALAKGDRVDVWLQMPKLESGARLDDIKRGIDAVRETARALGLRIEIRAESAAAAVATERSGPSK